MKHEIKEEILEIIKLSNILSLQYSNVENTIKEQLYQDDTYKPRVFAFY